MDFAVYRSDVRHIIIDNLQFMTPRKSGYGFGGGGMSVNKFERFDVQDAALDRFRQVGFFCFFEALYCIRNKESCRNQSNRSSLLFFCGKNLSACLYVRLSVSRSLGLSSRMNQIQNKKVCHGKRCQCNSCDSSAQGRRPKPAKP